MRSAKNILVVGWILLCLQARAVTFKFMVAVASNTSAGIYRPDGTLVRTLWSGVRYEAGKYTGTWDGTDDEGRLAANGRYMAKVLTNNVKYQWEGVIGNNSDSVSGNSVYHSLNRIHSMVFAGNHGYFCRNQSEGIPSQAKFNIAHPRTKLPVLHATGTSLSAIFNCTDGTNVYWGGNDAFGGPNKHFVYATKVSDDSEVIFANGIPGQATYGRPYASVIDYVDYPESTISGMAVQESGDLLFVSHYFLGVIRIFNKRTGALVNNFLMPKPASLAVDGNDDLWVSYSIGNEPRVQKFHADIGGILLPSLVVLPDLVYPVAIAVSPDHTTVTVADAANSQQVKAYSNQTGAPLWTMGEAGGYGNGPEVRNDKFYFSDARNVYGNYIAYQADGSFWVGDPGNNRNQHFAADRSYLECIMYQPNSYCITLDANRPNRIFSEYLEFNIDYTKPLAIDNGSWTLVRNWGYTIPVDQDNIFGKLKGVVTMDNGRSYMLLRRNVDGRFEVVELPDTGNIRYTGIIIDDVNAQLYPDGSIRSVSGINLGAPTTWTIRPLTGFDATNNPVWAAVQPIASSPPATRNDPLYWGNGTTLRSGEITSSNVLVSFDGGLTPNGSDRWHLGGIRPGTNQWLWKTAISTPKSYSGPFPPDGAYDNGNGSQYAGSVGLVQGHNIFWGFHGEFWKQSQTNIWNQVYDDGLFIGQFGVAGRPTMEAPPGMAGNSFSAVVTTDRLGDVYLYHNDESYHSGVHRWKITGLATIHEDSVSIDFGIATGGLMAEYYDNPDLNNMAIKTSRIDSVVDMAWSGVPPFTNISNADGFSVGWKGYIAPTFSEPYTFFIETDHAARLWVDGKLLVDHWNGQGGTWSGNIVLAAGSRYGIRLEYRHDMGNAKCILSWSSNSQPKTVIPSEKLSPTIAVDRSNGVDLMENLVHNSVLKNNQYGWSRLSDTEDYTSGEKWWSVLTSQKAYDSTASPDVFIKFRQSTGSYTITRDLGNAGESVASWSLLGKINYDGNTANTDGGGSQVEVVDVANKVIARFYTKITNGHVVLLVNERSVGEVTQENVQSVAYQFQAFEIKVAANGLTLNVGAITIGPFPILDPLADWRSPSLLKLSFWSTNSNYDRVMDLKDLRFKAAPYKLLCGCKVTFQPMVPIMVKSKATEPASISNRIVQQ